MADGTSVGSLYYDLDIDDKNLQSGLNKADKSVQSFGDNAQAAFRDTAKVLAVVGGGLTIFAKSATDYTVQAVKDAKSLGREIGVSTTEASRLAAAFHRMGIETDDVRQMFGIFSKNIVQSTSATKDNQLAVEKLHIEIDKTKQKIAETTAEIQKHGDKSGELTLKIKDLNNTLSQQQSDLGKTADIFQKLGIKTTDASGKQKDFNTILGEVADTFKKMPDGPEKTADAMELFGRKGKEMIKVLNLGADGIRDLEKRADDLHLTLNEKTIASVSGLIESQKKLKEQTDKVKIAVGTATAPVLTKFNEKLNDIIQTVVDTDGPMKNMATNILAFGGPVSTGAAGVAGFLGNISNIGPKIARAGAAAVIGAAVIGGSAYLIHQNWDTIGPMFDTVKAKINQALNSETFKRVAAELTTAFNAIKDALVNDLLPALDHFRDSFQRLYDAASPGLTTVLGIIASYLGGLLYGAVQLILGGLNILIQVFSAVANAVSNVIGWISNFIGWIGTAASWVGDKVGEIGRWFGQLPGRAADAVNSIIDFFRRLPGEIGNAIAGVPGRFIGILHAAVSAVWDFWGAFVDAGWGLMRAFASGISGAANLPVAAAKAVLNHVRDMLPFSDAKTGPLSDLTLSGRRFGQTFAKGVVANGSAIADAVQSTLVKPAMAMAGNFGANVIAPSVMSAPNIGGTAAGGTTRYGDTVVNIGEIHNEQDEAYVLRRMDRNAQLVSMGGAPLP